MTTVTSPTHDTCRNSAVASPPPFPAADRPRACLVWRMTGVASTRRWRRQVLAPVPCCPSITGGWAGQGAPPLRPPATWRPTCWTLWPRFWLQQEHSVYLPCSLRLDVSMCLGRPWGVRCCVSCFSLFRPVWLCGSVSLCGSVIGRLCGWAALWLCVCAVMRLCCCSAHTGCVVVCGCGYDYGWDGPRSCGMRFRPRVRRSPRCLSLSPTCLQE